jgi:SAM-dependent methyltransferase
MTVAPDGSPVEVYCRLAPQGEPELIATALPPGATVLEIGSGTGRLTHPLLELGFRVTAVDNEPEMLAHVRGAETVLADAERLDLGRRFDCVLLASHFVNDADDRSRRELLRACARHLEADGLLLAEAYPPELDWAAGRETRLGDVVVRLAEVERNGDLVRAAMEYEVDEMRWRQPFTARILDEDALRDELARVGLRFERWLARERGWLVARQAST